MVRPTVICTATAVKKVAKVKASNSDLAQKMVSNEAFRNKVLLNTANRWAKGKYKFTGDLTFSRLHTTGKSVKIKVDGVEKPKAYCFSGTKEHPFLIAPSMSWNK